MMGTILKLTGNCVKLMETCLSLMRMALKAGARGASVAKHAELIAKFIAKGGRVLMTRSFFADPESAQVMKSNGFALKILRAI